jgi:hypothetical protein
MTTLKKALGLVWMALGPVVLFYLIKTGASEIAKAEIAQKSVLDAKIQWGVFIIVFIPIAFGLVLFGYYALKGEYDEYGDEVIEP